MKNNAETSGAEQTPNTDSRIQMQVTLPVELSHLTPGQVASLGLLVKTAIKLLLGMANRKRE